MTPLQLIELIRDGRCTYAPAAQIHFTVIAHQRYDFRDLPRIEKAISELEALGGIRLEIISGGYACSKFDFRAEGSPEDVAHFLRLISTEYKVLEILRSIDAKFLNVPSEHTKRNLVTAENEFYKPAFKIEVHDSPNAVITIAPGATGIQAAGGDMTDTKLTFSSNNLDELFKLMELALRTDNRLSQAKLEEALQDIEVLKAQIKREPRRKEIIEPLLDGLSKISSIGSFIVALKQAF